MARKEIPLKHDLKAWFAKHIDNPKIVDWLTRERNPEKMAQRSARRRREIFTDQELDTLKVSLREYLDMRDKLELEIIKRVERNRHTELARLDERITSDETAQERDTAKRRSADATSAQGGTDRKLTETRREIAELKAERDAARKAYLDLLDMIAKAEGGK